MADMVDPETRRRIEEMMLSGGQGGDGAQANLPPAPDPGASTDQMTGDQLAALQDPGAQVPPTPDAPALPQGGGALGGLGADPSAGADPGAQQDPAQVEQLQSVLGADMSPQDRQQIMAELALAARRRMAGV